MKKILVMALSVALIATMAITGTIAYLSDQDAAVNQATVGTVFVEQTEWERKTNADGALSTELQPFTQYQQVVPAVYGTEIARSNVTLENGEQVGMPALTGTNSIRNYIDKIVYAKNTGTAEAYMRTVIAVPANSENWLHLDLGTSWTPATQRIKNVTIAGQPDTFDLIVLTSEAKIAGGAYAAPSLLGFYVDKDVNNVKGEDGQLSHYTYNGTNIGNISDLRILVATQAVQTEGFDTATAAFEASLGDVTSESHPWTIAASSTPSTTHTPGTAAELKTLMNSLIDTKTNNTVYLEANKTYDLTGIEWTPVSVNGSYVGTITLDGRGATIKGLDAPLFYGGEQGDEGSVVIKNLTIADSTLTNNKTFPTTDSSNNIAGGYGAFVAFTEKPVTLENCHLKNVKINGNEAKTGGLVGYSTTYSADKKIIITNCSVENCEISSKGSVGGIVGHATGASHVTTNISNCTVKNTKLTSTDESYRVGAIAGTTGAGTVNITSCTNTGNTITQNSSTAEGTIANPHAGNDLYGRITDGQGGTLIIDGATMTETQANS